MHFCYIGKIYFAVRYFHIIPNFWNYYVTLHYNVHYFTAFCGRPTTTMTGLEVNILGCRAIVLFRKAWQNSNDLNQVGLTKLYRV